MRLSLVLPVALLAACKFPYPADVADDDVTGTDAGRQCEPSTIVCDDARGEYVACSATGTVDMSMVCPLGCAPDAEKCLDIDPHNGLAMYLDMVANPPDLILNGPATIDSNAGAILDGAISLTVPTFVHAQANADSVRVFVVHRLVINASLTARKGRSMPIAFIATGEVEVRGPVDIGADRNLPGPGGSTEQDVFDGNRNCEGQPVLGGGPGQFTPGGSGGGGNTPGGRGAGSGQAKPTPGGRMGLGLQPLAGGCSGGPVSGVGVGSSGGTGGGALMIASRVSIRITGQGTIDASGGGATASPARIAGAGGGAGGVILLEAPQVILDGPTVALSTKGGGGAGASEATAAGNGADGGLDAAPAAGGTAPALASGGYGGTSSAPQDGFFSQAIPGNGGGGGGAAGTTAVFTTAGVIAPQNGAAIRGPLASDRLLTRRIP